MCGAGNFGRWKDDDECPAKVNCCQLGRNRGPNDRGSPFISWSSRAVIFPVAVGQNVFLMTASFLDTEVPLLISMGVGEAAGECD